MSTGGGGLTQVSYENQDSQTGYLTVYRDHLVSGFDCDRRAHLVEKLIYRVFRSHDPLRLS